MSASNPNDKIVHTYDDIQEEDNHLPNWWLFILFGTIVFSFGYWFVYHTTRKLESPVEEYAREVEALKKAQLAANPTSDEAIAELAKNPVTLEEGKTVFSQTCASCHAAQGQGLVGPNLTDKFWIHGNKPTDLVNAVANGFPDKGMPGWGAPLGPEKTRKVAAYVLSLRNTNVAGKEPQGEPVE